MKSDGSEVKDLLGKDQPSAVIYPAWSPDGSQLVFGGSMHGQPIQLYVVNSDGSSPSQITQGTTNKFYPAWSYDGQYIAYAEEINPRAGQLWVYDLVEDKHTKLTGAELPLMLGPRPNWKPAGKAVSK
jgi:Tol biopolymer transport system component